MIERVTFDSVCRTLRVSRVLNRKNRSEGESR